MTGKKLDIGESLRDHTSSKIDEIVNKYALEPIDCSVIVTKDGYRIITDFDLHLGKGINVRTHSEADDPYVSVDAALETLEKQLRKYKKRITDHHKKRDVEYVKTSAQQYVLDSSSESQELEAPVIIAEMNTDIPTLSVGEAVMHMDLSNSPALLFLNGSHGKMNLVYKRADGNIGWVDPHSAS
ncbi:ribosome hibernation-promoting factor, HPF/YfiA family [Candidatus Bealeia paramacronuclearis]